MATPQTQRSVPELLQSIVSNLEEIIRSEFRLAKAEFRAKASRAAQPAATFGTGAVLAFYGLGFLLLACVYALSLLLPGWLAALVVGAVLAVLASVLMASGSKKLKRIDPTPHKTIQTLEENLQWTKRPIK